MRIEPLFADIGIHPDPEVFLEIGDLLSFPVRYGGIYSRVGLLHDRYDLLLQQFKMDMFLTLQR